MHVSVIRAEIEIVIVDHIVKERVHLDFMQRSVETKSECGSVQGTGWDIEKAINR